jgi:hypothetical protein
LNSIFCEEALLCAVVLCGFFIKNEHPKGFGALEDCPNKLTVALPRLAAAGSAIV